MDRFRSQGPHDAPGGRLAIGACVLDLARGELFTGAGERAALRPKVLELLCVLGGRAGEVVGKDELLQSVWPDVVVTEDSLTQAVAEIRRCVGDTRHEWLRTVPRRGYSLVKSAATATGAVPHRLPALDAPLLGRAGDLAPLGDLLQPGALVTVLGAGGIGKTRLALELAHRAAERPGGAAWWVDLAPATDAAQVLPMLAAALGVPTSGSGAREQLAAALGRRRGLLVLDNCEHRASELAELVQALRGAAPRLAWLATSQTPLQLQAEQLYRLGTLEVPTAGAALDEARHCGALALLEQRARASDHRFALDGATLPWAIGICQRLDGVALALEMAAARLPALGVRGVHDRLVARLDTLSSDRRDLAPRHRSLLATLEWSCSLLTAAQQQALQALARFAGRFEAGSACAVIGTDDALDVLGTLVDKSLVSVDSGEPRHYRLLESMRLYALERLRCSPAADAVIARHRRAMAAVATQFDKDCARGRTDALMWRYLPQLSDLAAAFESACRDQDTEALAILLNTLRTLDAMRGVQRDLEPRLRAALPLLPQASPADRARICLVVASCGWIKLPGLTAASAAAQAVQALRGRPRARWLLRQGLLLLAIEQARSGEAGPAGMALDEALGLVDDGEPLERRAVVQASASHVAWYAGDSARALGHMQSACDFAERAGAASTHDYALSHLSDLALATGDIEAARRHAAQAVQRMRERHTQDLLALSLTSAMEAELAAGDLCAARRLVGEAIEHAHGAGVLGIVAGAFAALALHLGDHGTGCRLLGWVRAHHPPEPNAPGHALAERLRVLALEAETKIGATAVRRLQSEGASMAQAEVAALAATLGAAAR